MEKFKITDASTRRSKLVPRTTVQTLAKAISDLFPELRNRHHEWEGKDTKAVQTILKTISKALHRGEKVKVEGFGTFEIQTFQPRKMAISWFPGKRPSSNPLNLNPPRSIIDLPVRKRVIFKPSRALNRFILETMPPEGDLPNESKRY